MARYYSDTLMYVIVYGNKDSERWTGEDVLSVIENNLRLTLCLHLQ